MFQNLQNYLVKFRHGDITPVLVSKTIYLTVLFLRSLCQSRMNGSTDISSNDGTRRRNNHRNDCTLALHKIKVCEEKIEVLKMLGNHN